MSDFEDAVKQLGMPICPNCGELRQIERLNSHVWRCDVCSKPFDVQPRPGLFKVLPR